MYHACNQLHAFTSHSNDLFEYNINILDIRYLFLEYFQIKFEDGQLFKNSVIMFRIASMWIGTFCHAFFSFNVP